MRVSAHFKMFGIPHTQTKNAFRLQFPYFKGKISMSAAIEPVWDRNNNSEDAYVKYYSYPIFFFFFVFSS